MFKDKLTYKYQPIVDMFELSLVRHEALLRLDGVCDIEGFTRGLERSGQIIELDLHTLNSVIAQHENAEEQAPIVVAINVSAISLTDKAFQRTMLETLSKRPHTLDISLEITESAPISNMAVAAEFVKQLQDIGCSVGMDDYGDGYASLETLEQLHLDYLKLSACLTTSFLASDIANLSILKATKAAKAMNLKVVAEHIDNIRQYLLLKDMGIHYGQGWLFAKADDLIIHPKLFQNELRAKIFQGIQDSF
jgi:EAL domain-containing protein (putative c-di-GMP-specific phosphodiesterase class I)